MYRDSKLTGLMELWYRRRTDFWIITIFIVFGNLSNSKNKWGHRSHIVTFIFTQKLKNSTRGERRKRRETKKENIN